MASAPLAWHATKRMPNAIWLASLASLAGWIALAAMTATSPSFGDLCISVGSGGVDVDTQLARLGFAWLSLLLVSSTIMLAMMPPLMVGALLHVWRRSLAKRRVGALLLFVAGYAVAWLPVWLFVSQLTISALRTTSRADWSTFVLPCALALGWQATPLKQASLNACHRRLPVSAFGVWAELDVVAFGLRQGYVCIGNCWALMLVPLAAGGNVHLVLMACATLLLLQELTPAPANPRWGATLPARPRRGRLLTGALRA